MSLDNEGVTDKSPCGFHDRDGWLYCDDLPVSQLHQQLRSSAIWPSSPAFVYSRRRIEQNVHAYRDALRLLPVPSVLHFSVKANHNLQILSLLQSLGCGVTLVSGMELKVAKAAGFSADSMLLNGSGKTAWEVTEAVKEGVLLNVDSEFDLQQLLKVCQELGLKARVLLRLNLDIDPMVHQYVSTGKVGSKFGLDAIALNRVLHILSSDECPVHVVGLHCHLGSTITNSDVLRWTYFHNRESVARMLEQRQELKRQGLQDLRLINIGGGLGIDYTCQRDETKPYRLEEKEFRTDLDNLRDHFIKAAAEEENVDRKELLQSVVSSIDSYSQERVTRAELDKNLTEKLGLLGMTDEACENYSAIFGSKKCVPSPSSLTEAIAGLFQSPRDDDVTVMVEPGRSIVGDAGALVTSVLGCKMSGAKRFVVVDGAMTEVIRPSLYGAYHHIQLAAPCSSVLPSLDAAYSAFVDVVGPVCESTDFLGKDRLLPVPPPGACAVVRDTGAYCASMASNYNLRLRPAEVLVEGNTWRLIRKPDCLEDILHNYIVET
ncbi:diaminopimelate decarboxylase 1, chloroplastic-like [Pomacea canaliculata]|uniref:diaminopimelate decarboxylase 1, chloroplastic-like n=1 Tax=Pomacea canaliculata TaxID=400727 RepID=UPI000D733373|nr:diaminopimelate decarboxylase 1, chloroplastic-like [Pomacea canaliculata]